MKPIPPEDLKDTDLSERIIHDGTYSPFFREKCFKALRYRAYMIERWADKLEKEKEVRMDIASPVYRHILLLHELDNEIERLEKEELSTGKEIELDTKRGNKEALERKISKLSYIEFKLIELREERIKIARQLRELERKK